MARFQGWRFGSCWVGFGGGVKLVGEFRWWVLVMVGFNGVWILRMAIQWLWGWVSVVELNQWLGFGDGRFQWWVGWLVVVMCFAAAMSGGFGRVFMSRLSPSL